MLFQMNIKNKNQLNFMYNPLNDPTYMSKEMTTFFKEELYDMLAKLEREEILIAKDSQSLSKKEADYVESSQIEEMNVVNNLAYQNEAKLKLEIENALYRINNGTYGYCLETGNPIGVKRLMVSPIAAYTKEVQADKEKSLNN
jgi:DnaK suppressor protein